MLFQFSSARIHSSRTSFRQSPILVHSSVVVSTRNLSPAASNDSIPFCYWRNGGLPFLSGPLASIVKRCMSLLLACLTNSCLQGIFPLAARTLSPAQFRRPLQRLWLWIRKHESGVGATTPCSQPRRCEEGAGGIGGNHEVDNRVRMTRLQ